MAIINSQFTFEERLKSQKVKRKKALMIKLSVILSLFTLLAVYFFIPLSHASNTKVEGNIYYSVDQILALAKVSKEDSLYILSNKDIKKNLDSSPLLGGNTKVNITPFGMKIVVDEVYPVFYSEADNNYYLSDGNVINDSIKENENVNVGQFIKDNLDKTVCIDFIPNTTNITKKVYKSFVNIISNISLENRQLIDHVSYSKETNSLSFYYKLESSNDYIKFVCCLNSTIYEEGIHKVLTKKQIDERKKYIEKTKKEPIMENDKNVYSWEVILEENKDDYFVKFIDIKEVQNG